MEIISRPYSKLKLKVIQLMAKQKFIRMEIISRPYSKLKLKVIQLMVKQQLTVQVVHRKISILGFIFSHTALNVQSYIDNNRHV